MRKLLPPFVVALALTVLLAGCGSKQDAAATHTKTVYKVPPVCLNADTSAQATVRYLRKAIATDTKSVRLAVRQQYAGVISSLKAGTTDINIAAVDWSLALNEFNKCKRGQ